MGMFNQNLPIGGVSICFNDERRIANTQTYTQDWRFENDSIVFKCRHTLSF